MPSRSSRPQGSFAGPPLVLALFILQFLLALLAFPLRSLVV
jgi:hypothetical protein